MVSVAGNSLALSSPSSGAAAGGGTTWAYGGLKELHASGLSGTTGSTEVAYSANGTFGFAVVLTETQESGGVYVVNVSRVMGSILTVHFCRPTCASPVATASILHRSWESLNASVILVTDGTVTTPTGNVSALALRSSTLELSAGLRDSAVYTVSGTLERSHNLSASLVAHDALSLFPPLGLFPLNITAGETWSSSSNYQQAGAYNWSLSNQVSGAMISPVAKGYARNGSGTFNTSGQVSLRGGDSGQPVDLGGSPYQALNLTVQQGAFLLREGFLLLPRAADLFGATRQAWLSNETGFANATQVNFEVASQLVGANHLALAGSGEWWLSRANNPLPPGPASVLSPAVSVSSPSPRPNATYVQGAPESPSQAATQQNCLLTDTNCPAGSLPFRGAFGTIVLVGAVVLVAVFAAALVVGQRRRLPPPVYPNASLYPPGQNLATTRGAASEKPASSPPAAEEEDPLGHLW